MLKAEIELSAITTENMESRKVTIEMGKKGLLSSCSNKCNLVRKLERDNTIICTRKDLVHIMLKRMKYAIDVKLKRTVRF